MSSDDFKRRTSQVLQRASLAQRCEEVTKIIEESSTKELHGFFPELLGSIFGYDTNADWGLKSVQRSGTYNQLKMFLGSTGPIFNLVNKLQVDGYLKYEFFIKCLPLPTQNSLCEGNIPLLYHNKIQMSNVASANSSRVVLLNAFEYYMFHFAYYIIYQQNINRITQDSNWLNDSQFVYLSILEDYLNHFLPTLPQSTVDSTIAPSLSNLQYTSWFGSMNRAQPCQKQFSGLIRITSPLGNANLAMQSHGAYDQNSGDIWRSETFLQILIEFWLNQNTMDSVTRNVLSRGQVYFMPSVDLVQVVRMLVKQIHTFVYSAGIEALNHQAISPRDELKRIIIPQMLQKRFYCFLRHGFAHWPLDPSFRVVVETWLSFIQPWRYANNPTRAKSDTSQVYTPEWCSFVHENFPFFSVIVQEFVLRALKLDLHSSKDVFILLRVSKVLAQEGLVDTIEGAEKLLSESPKNALRGSHSGMGVAIGSSVRANYLDLEGNGYNYVLEDKLEGLVCNVSNALRNISNPVVGSHGQRSQGTGEGSMGWLKSLFSGEFLDSDYGAKRDTDKVTSYLEQSYKNLTSITKINYDVTDLGQPSTPNAASDRLIPSITSTSTLSHGSIPECIQTDRGFILTERGKYQMINGIRRFEIHYNGDPELQPIRSYENPTLVRLLYHFSMYLNAQIGDKLNNIYTSPGYLSSIACKLSPCLRNPTYDPLRTPHPTSTALNATLSSPSSQDIPIPRISLRFLASFKTMFYFSLFYLFCKLFSLGSLTILALFILVLLLSVVGHVCPVHSIDDREVQKKLF